MRTETQKIRGADANRRVKRTEVRAPFKLTMLVLIAAIAPALSARADDEVSNEYQFTLSPHHAIRGNLTGSGELGYHWNPELDYQAYTILWPGLICTASKWAQFSAGLRTLYTDNENSADKLELRPFAGVKLFLPTELKWNLYNYTRYEFRDIQDRDTLDWIGTHRVRSRFAVELPLTSREKSWQPKTWYGLADVEPFYRFDKDTIDPLLVRGGLGYVVSDRVRLECFYYAQFTRPAGSSSLEHTENAFRLNIKIGLHEGLLRRLQNPSHE